MALQPIKLSTTYQPLYTSKKNYFLITGGRGSLKSTTVHDFIARLMFERGHGVLFTRYTMDSAKDSIIPEFRLTLEKHGTEHHFEITNEKIINKLTGSFVLFKGIKQHSKNNTGKLKSIPGITTWIIEEGEDFTNEKEFHTIDDGIREAGKDLRVIFIMNPTDRNHFIYKNWIKDTHKKVKVKGFDVSMSTHPKVEHIHTTYHIANQFGYLDDKFNDKKDSYVAKLLNDVNEIKNSTLSEGEKKTEIYRIMHTSHYFTNYIGGWLEFKDGVVFTNWKVGEFVETGYSGYGGDYGYSPDPQVLVEVSIDKKHKKLYIREILYRTKVVNVVDEYSALKVKRGKVMVMDSSEPRTTNKIKKAGYRVNSIAKQPHDIKADLRELQDYEIIITPKSKNIIHEFQEYAWNDKKTSTPFDRDNHAIDSMRYIYKTLIYGKYRRLT